MPRLVFYALMLNFQYTENKKKRPVDTILS